MGSGRGRSRRAQSSWQNVLWKSFPVDNISSALCEDKKTLRYLVELNSAVYGQGPFTRLHDARHAPAPGFAFVGGHTSVVKAGSSECDCENSYTTHTHNKVSKGFVCAHKMAGMIPVLFENAEGYERNQRGLDRSEE